MVHARAISHKTRVDLLTPRHVRALSIIPLPHKFDLLFTTHLVLRLDLLDTHCIQNYMQIESYIFKISMIIFIFIAT